MSSSKSVGTAERKASIFVTSFKLLLATLRVFIQSNPTRSSKDVKLLPCKLSTSNVSWKKGNGFSLWIKERSLYTTISSNYWFEFFTPRDATVRGSKIISSPGHKFWNSRCSSLRHFRFSKPSTTEIQLCPKYLQTIISELNIFNSCSVILKLNWFLTIYWVKQVHQTPVFFAICFFANKGG